MQSSRPEIEPEDLLLYLSQDDERGPPNALYEVLELRPARQGTPGAAGDEHRSAELDAVWSKSLDGEGLRRAWTTREPQPRLRIVFASNTSQIPYDNVIIDGETRSWLQKKLSISPIFLHHVASEELGIQLGNASFSRLRKDGSVYGLCGFYSCRISFSSPLSHVWFYHDLQSQTSTYFIVFCPKRSMKRIRHMTQSGQLHRLSLPLVVDVILADDYATLSKDDIRMARDQLLAYENIWAGTLGLDTAHAVEQLHGLSQRWHVFSGELNGFEDRLQFLLEISRKVFPAPGRNALEESIDFLLSRNRGWKLWVENYNQRTNVRIGLFFNLASQSDSRTNLEIARLTSDIAVDTQKDSSSMITHVGFLSAFPSVFTTDVDRIAVLTMFFLPGTFVSAIFSMVFFDFGTDSQGKQTFAVSPRWWYFLAATVPLTILVFAVWMTWHRYRYRSRSKSSPFAKLSSKG